MEELKKLQSSVMEESFLKDSLLEGSPLECSICLERMKDVSYLITQPDDNGNICTHYFCTKCIQPLVTNAKEKAKTPCCPACRRPILSVTKSRVCDELIKEANFEREQRKQVQNEKTVLEKENKKIKERDNKTKEMKKNYKSKIKELQATSNETKQECQKLKDEVQSLTNQVEEGEKLKLQLRILKIQMDEDSKKWNLMVKQLNDTNQLLKLQIDLADSSLQAEKKRNLLICTKKWKK